MSDLSSMTPEQMDDFLKSLGKSSSDVGAEAANVLEESAANASKPLGTLADILPKEALQKSVRVPADQVISDLPTPKMMDAREKLAQAARGSASETPIEMPAPAAEAASETAAKAAPEAASAAGEAAAKAAPDLLGEAGGTIGEVGGMAGDAMGMLGRIAAKIGVPVAVAYEMLKPMNAGEKPTAGDMEGKPVPGRPGMIFKGQDIVPVKYPQAFGPDATPYNMFTPSDKEEGPASVSASVKAKGSAGLPKAAPTEGVKGNKDYIQELIDKAYGPLGGMDPMMAAMATRNGMQTLASVSKAANMLGAAMSRGTAKANTEVQDDLMKQAQEPLQDVAMLRGMKEKNLEGAMKASDLYDKAALRDPNSPVSASYRATALQIMPGLAKDPNFKNMDAESVKQLSTMIDMKGKLDYMAAMKNIAMQQKITMDSQKAKSEMGKTLQTAMQRGTAAQAQLGVLAADKITDLFNKEPNPEKWNKDQVHLFRTELERMAKGGIPSEHGTAALLSPTLSSMLAGAGQMVTGDVIGTGQGAQIKNLLPYIQDVRKTSVDYIKNNVYEPVMRAYNRRVTPEDLQDYKLSLPHDYYGGGMAPIPGATAPQGAGPGPAPANPFLSIQQDPDFQKELAKRQKQ